MHFPTVIKGSLCLSFKVQLCDPDFIGFGCVVTQCGTWDWEENIHTCTIELYFLYWKIAVDSLEVGWGGGAGHGKPIAKNLFHITIWHHITRSITYPHITSLWKTIAYTDIYHLKWKKDGKYIAYTYTI